MSEKLTFPSPTFCVYPWIEQVVQSNGGFSFCCVANEGGHLKKEDGTYFQAGSDKVSDAWNSTEMRDIRKAMLAGEKVEQCKLCYFQESIGKKSYREMHNEEWQTKAADEIQRRIEESKQNDYKISKPPLYLDLRLGNLCNLKCRSCNPYNSSQIHRETTQLLESDDQYKKFWSKYFGSAPGTMSQWFEGDMFWDEVIAAIPNIRKVYLTGGEPTLIEKNYKFLQACVDSGHAKNIFLMFNTNCTNIQDRFLEILPHFEFVLINASIDGFGSTNEYIRFLSRWETIDKNFQKLLQLKGNIKIGATPVVQIYNILEITNLLNYFETMSMKYKRVIGVDFLYATHPECIDLSFLPVSIKKVAIQRLEDFIRKSISYDVDPLITNSIDSCLNLLKNTDEKVSHERLSDFINFTQSLDRNRKQNFAQQFPELNSMLGMEGYQV